MAEDLSPAPVPDAIRHLAILWIITGLINMTLGAVVAYVGWLVVGFVVGVICGLICPFCVMLPLCGLGSFFLVPLGGLQLVVGLLSLGLPDVARRVLPWLSLLGLFTWVLGDISTPIAGLVSLVFLRDPAAREWLQQ